MGIYEALNELVIIQKSIVTNKPDFQEQFQIKEAYPTVPPADNLLPTTPCMINSWSVAPIIQQGGLVEQAFDIRMQLFIRNAKQDVGAMIANAFWDAFVAKFVTIEGKLLNGTIAQSTLSGGTPTLVGWERAGGPFVGLDMHLDITIKLFF